MLVPNHIRKVGNPGRDTGLALPGVCVGSMGSCARTAEGKRVGAEAPAHLSQKAGFCRLLCFLSKGHKAD